MKAYQGSFKKADGDIRSMHFVRLPDLPESFLDGKVKGQDAKKRVLKEGMETVWDVTAQGFRTFNWSTVLGEVEEIILEENSLFP